MMKVTLFTSGSTKEPKQITHNDMLTHIKRSVAEIGLRSDDVVLDVFLDVVFVSAVVAVAVVVFLHVFVLII